MPKSNAAPIGDWKSAGNSRSVTQCNYNITRPGGICDLIDHLLNSKYAGMLADDGLQALPYRAIQVLSCNWPLLTSILPSCNRADVIAMASSVSLGARGY